MEFKLFNEPKVQIICNSFSFVVCSQEVIRIVVFCVRMKIFFFFQICVNEDDKIILTNNSCWLSSSWFSFNLFTCRILPSFIFHICSLFCSHLRRKRNFMYICLFHCNDYFRRTTWLNTDHTLLETSIQYDHDK